MANPIIEDIRSKIRNGNPVTLLILLNVAVFLIISLLRILLFLTGNFGALASFVNFVIDNISLNLSIQGLLFKPWTLITHMFTHIELAHIFWNMITLYWFGTILSDYTSVKKIIPIYLLGGIFGALFTILLSLFPPFHFLSGATAIGASAGVTAIIVAAATLVPNYRINLLLIGPIKLVYVAIFSIFIDVLNLASYTNVGGNLAHLGGALMGYIFIVQYKKGRDLSKGINRFFDWIGRLFKSSPAKSKMKAAYKRSVSDEEYNYSKKSEQEQIDKILDKISKSGYESLSKTEKEILFKASGKK